jgi:long-chain acyl-CoA synthetase
MKHPWDRSLGVWTLAKEHPDRPAVIACPAGESLTFAQLAARAHQVVHALRALGLGYGDVVGLTLPNDVDMLIWQLAAAEAGWRYITLNPMSSAEEVATIADHSGMKALIVDVEFAERAGAVTGVPIRISTGGEISGFRPQAEILRGQPDTEPDDRRSGAGLVYTSGTTGQPKGIWRPLPEIGPDLMADSMKLFARAFRFQPLRGAHLVSAGMFHGGCQAFYLGALHVGQGLVIMRRFDAEQTLRLIHRHRISTGYMVPTQFTRLLQVPDEIRAESDLSSLESIVHSAAPCPTEI